VGTEIRTRKNILCVLSGLRGQLREKLAGRALLAYAGRVAGVPARALEGSRCEAGAEPPL